MKTTVMKIKKFGIFCLLFGLGMVLMPSTGQCFYNPNSGKWLSRDPKGENGGPNPYCVVDNYTTGSVDGRGDRVVRFDGTSSWTSDQAPPLPPLPTAADPFWISRHTPVTKVGACGDSFGRVQWHINGTPSGWILQHIIVKPEVEDCSGATIQSPNNQARNFTEAWQVVNGVIYGGFKDPGEWLGGIDTWNTVPEGDGRKGRIRIFGWVKFIENYSVTIPPWTTDSPNPAGVLPYIKPTPSGWTDQGARPHVLLVAFNCCCANPFSVIFDSIK